MEFVEIARKDHLKLGARVPNAQGPAVCRPQAIDRHAFRVKGGEEIYALPLRQTTGREPERLLVIFLLVDDDGSWERSISVLCRHCFCWSSRLTKIRLGSSHLQPRIFAGFRRKNYNSFRVSGQHVISACASS